MRRAYLLCCALATAPLTACTATPIEIPGTEPGPLPSAGADAGTSMPDAAPARDRGAPPPPLADAFGGGGDAGATDAGIAPPDSGPQGDGGPSTGDGGPDAADDGAVDGPGPDAVLEAGPGDLGSSVDLPTADATTDDGPLAGG